MSAVNITFRASQLPANIPTTTTVKGTPLTHLELDGNLLSLRDAILARAMAHNAALTGIPTAPTAAVGTNTTQLATTAFVATESDARSYRALNGRAIPLTENTNIQEWADTVPPSGLYDVQLTAPQGNLPAGWWYLELLVHHNASVPTNMHSTITATLLDGASGIKFSNTRTNAGWGGWVPMVPVAATDAVSGIVELATGAEAAAGTDGARVLSPAALRAGLNATGSAPVFACRAWINLHGGTRAIRGSGNVSSVTGTVNQYNVNFITAMPHAGFCILDGTGHSAGAHGSQTQRFFIHGQNATAFWGSVESHFLNSPPTGNTNQEFICLAVIA